MRLGGARLGMARPGGARQGRDSFRVGGGSANLTAWLGRVRRGKARLGLARQGKARCHLVGELRIVPAASESRGEVGHGGERIGTAWL